MRTWSAFPCPMQENNTYHTIRHWIRNGLTFLAEAFLWTGCSYLAILILHGLKTDAEHPFAWSLHWAWGLVLLIVVSHFIPNNAYSRTARRDEIVASAMKTVLAFNVLYIAVFTERDYSQYLSCLLFFVVLTVERLILNSWFIRYSMRHCEHGIIICNEESAWQQKALMQNTYGLKLERLEDQRAEQLEVFLTAHPETESVYLARSPLSATEMEDIAHTCRKQGVELHILPLASCSLPQTMLSECRGIVDVLSLAKPPLESIFNRTIKRMTDIALSLLVLLTVFPIFAVVAYICIKRQSRGPVLMTRHMCGMNGKTFQCLTFRTRHFEAAPSFLEGINDPGYFPFGKFLSITRLELLPQFLCVLWGSMTIVGSQMMQPELYPEYHRELRQHFVLNSRLKAGITNYYLPAQGKGNAKADVWYFRNWGFWLDMRIMLQRLGTLRKQSKAKSINYI